ncbi:MAG: CDP-2,3-bis-(O-geranylgeranyl)-sn-glycerol synthase [Candidatus Saccharimonadales bacterium]
MHVFWNLIYYSFWFFAPAGVANMAPVLANKIPILNRWKTPVDFGLSFHNRRLLGDNKTWRGVVFGTVLAGLTGTIIYLLFYNFQQTSLLSACVIGFSLGFGALIGDCVESIAKRLRGIEPGQRWFPFDQTDYIIGGLIAVSFLVHLELKMLLTVFILFFVLHIFVAFIGYKLGLKSQAL